MLLSSAPTPLYIRKGRKDAGHKGREDAGREGRVDAGREDAGREDAGREGRGDDGRVPSLKIAVTPSPRLSQGRRSSEIVV